MENELTPEKLLEDIKTLVYRHRLNHIDAMIYYCEMNDYDVDSIATIIPASLKADIEEDARNMKLLKKQFNFVRTLPV